MRRSARISLFHTFVGSALLLVAAAGNALAGGFGIEQSAYYQGMSYAGAAAGGPSLASLAWNPATAGFADQGLAFEASMSLIFMDAELTVSNPGAQLVPGSPDVNMGRNAPIGASFTTYRLDSKTVLALSLTSPFGLGTKANDANWAGQFEGLTTYVLDLNATPIVSYEIARGVFVAAGLQLDYFGLKRQTAATPLGTGNLKADDIGVGFVLGIDYAPSPDTSIGLGFRSAINHNLEGHVQIYGVDKAPINASVDLPEMLSLGVRQAITPTTRLTGEVEWVNWSRFGTIPIILDGPFLGAPAGATTANLDFGWRDGWLFAIGGEYDWSRELTLRTGLGYEISPVGNAQARLVQNPDSDRIWASIGASYKITADTRLDFSYSHVFFEDNAPFDRTPSPVVLAGAPALLGTADVSMDIVSLGFKTVWGAPPPAPAALK